MRLAELRKKNNITQEQIAKDLNITQSSYSRYETEDTKITPTLLIQLSNYFNVSTDYLLEKTTDNLLENSYIPKSEIQELYDQLDDNGKRLAKSYIQGILDTQKNLKKSYIN